MNALERFVIWTMRLLPDGTPEPVRVIVGIEAGMFFILACMWLFLSGVDGIVDANPKNKPGTSYSARFVQISPTYQAAFRLSPLCSGLHDWWTRPRP